MLQERLRFSTQSDDPTPRLRVLTSALRTVRWAGDGIGAADTVPPPHPAVLAPQGALGLVEACLTQGRTNEGEGELELMEQRRARQPVGLSLPLALSGSD